MQHVYPTEKVSVRQKNSLQWFVKNYQSRYSTIEYVSHNVCPFLTCRKCIDPAQYDTYSTKQLYNYFVLSSIPDANGLQIMFFCGKLSVL